MAYSLIAPEAAIDRKKRLLLSCANEVVSNLIDEFHIMIPS
jgi:hypothetical protein